MPGSLVVLPLSGALQAPVPGASRRGGWGYRRGLRHAATLPDPILS